jgi:hypothetical protein
MGPSLRLGGERTQDPAPVVERRVAGGAVAGSSLTAGCS